MSETKRLHAVAVIRQSEMLAQTYALEIENGKVVEVKQLTKAEDLPAVAIGLGQKQLWHGYRTNKETPSVAKTKS